MFKEFKAFIMKGNLVDIAIAFVMGAAFTGVVTKFTTGIISPLVGAFSGGSFATKTWTLIDRTGTNKDVVLQYGAVLDAVINFVIVGFVCFLIVKGVNNMMARTRKQQGEVVDVSKSEEVLVLSEIRDLLAGR